LRPHVIDSAGARLGNTVRLVFHHINGKTTTIESDGWYTFDEGQG
jgi:hypothetical protein